MAFVCSSERNFQSVAFTPATVGPGTYQPSNTKPSVESCAPFMSTSSRPTKTQSKVVCPGPGDYEIQTNIVDPVIQAITNNRSIIVKINSTGTGPFKSLQDRFSVREQEVPGPGSYNVKEMERRQRLALQKPKRTRALSERKKTPSIPHKGASLYIQEVPKDEKGEVGPGAYELSQPFGDVNRGCSWGKDGIDRFKRREQTNQVNMGPGKYYMRANMEPDYKTNPSSSFVSETVRTYFDKLLFRTNQQFKAKLRMQGKYKSPQPGPGLYNTRVSVTPNASHLFGNSERWSEDIEATPGPGLYKFKSPFEHQNNRTSNNVSFDSKTTRQPVFINSDKNIPGPGAYQQPPSNKFKYSYGTTTFVDAKERFAQKILEQDESVPGPGSYVKQSKTVSVRSTNVFKSNTQRAWHNEADITPVVGSYNLDLTDISSKVQKQKTFIENLKKIDVQKAPFDSSNTRFRHYQQTSNEQEPPVTQKFGGKKKVRTAVNSSEPRNDHPAFFTGEKRFQNQKKKAPSVGTYSLQKPLESKSYNVKFQKK